MESFLCQFIENCQFYPHPDHLMILIILIILIIIICDANRKRNDVKQEDNSDSLNAYVTFSPLNWVSFLSMVHDDKQKHEDDGDGDVVCVVLLLFMMIKIFNHMR